MFYDIKVLGLFKYFWWQKKQKTPALVIERSGFTFLFMLDINTM